VLRIIHFVLISISISLVQAVPVYLTFTGNIEESNSNSTITAPQKGSATILIRADLDGDPYEYPNGWSFDDIGMVDRPGVFDLFRVDFISGPIFTGGLGNPYGSPEHNIHVGVVSGPLRNFLQMLVTPPDQNFLFSELFLHTPNAGSDIFEVGENYSVEGFGHDIDHRSAYWSGSFILTDISDLPPESVPEPNTMATFGLVLAGLVFCLNKKRT
jgi:hypothetical protein